MKLLINASIIISLLCSTLLYSKILIFTQSYNRPDFIEIHYHTFKKFLLDDYELIVFNDATNKEIYSEITQMCAQYQIKCIPMPQELHDPCNYPSVRHCSIIKYSLETLGFNAADIVAIIDSDMFLIREFSIREYLKNFDLAGQLVTRYSQHNVYYVWAGIAFLDMRTMPNKNTINFDPAIIENVPTDSGGSTYYYLKQNPEARVKYFDDIIFLDDFFCDSCKESNQISCAHNIDIMKNLDFSEPLIELTTYCQNYSIEIYLQNTFLHYRAGSNWTGDSSNFILQKTHCVNNFINEILA